MGERDRPPPLVALFVVVFDQKIGYTIAWKRSLDDVDLDGVEFKSLPSGLHAVKDDLVFFLHGPNAGVSAFIRESADVTHRNASFVAVGALVPLKYGQLGRSWAHAEELRGLGKDVVKDVSNTEALSAFWEQHREDNQSTKRVPSSLEVSRGSNATEPAKRNRAASEVSASDTAWPLDHPALHVPQLLETFGPLLFPLHRAALSRSRILLLGSPSVQSNSNVVYLTSVLSTIPKELAASLPIEAGPILRSSPLFSVGIHDMPELTRRVGEDGGWIATSTDEILGDKKSLYDLLVKLPSQTGLNK